MTDITTIYGHDPHLMVLYGIEKAMEDINSSLEQNTINLAKIAKALEKMAPQESADWMKGAL